MSDNEKLLCDIKTLMDSIKLDWREIDANRFKPEVVMEIKMHIKLCLDELKELHQRLDNIQI